MYVCMYVRICINGHLCTVVFLILQSLKKTEGSVYDSPRAMAKLLKEAERVKKVLSANNDHFAQVSWFLNMSVVNRYNMGITIHLCGV